MSVNYVALGKRIGYFRMQCGNITQEALASKINRSREFLAKIEKGTEHPSVATLVDIADALCISIDDLLIDSLHYSVAEVYTSGINDVSYARPLFGMLMCVNQFLFCIRLPYHMLVDAAGHFKQTRNGAIFEAFLNVIVSVTLVIKFGLIGVTIGTFCALLFRTLQYSVYASKNILHRKYRYVVEHIVLSIAQAVIVSLILNFIYVPVFDSYMNWILYAVEVAAVVMIVLLASSAIFNKREIRILQQKVKIFFERRTKTN